MDDTESVMLENLESYLLNLSPLQIFENFFSLEVSQPIFDNTVRYAIAQKNKPRFTVSFEEMEVFIKFLLLSGYYTLLSAKIIGARRRILVWTSSATHLVVMRV